MYDLHYSLSFLTIPAYSSQHGLHLNPHQQNNLNVMAVMCVSSATVQGGRSLLESVFVHALLRWSCCKKKHLYTYISMRFKPRLRRRQIDVPERSFVRSGVPLSVQARSVVQMMPFKVKHSTAPAKLGLFFLIKLCGTECVYLCCMFVCVSVCVLCKSVWLDNPETQHPRLIIKCNQTSLKVQ